MDDESDNASKPGFRITTNHIGLMLACWAAWTTLRDGIASWTMRQARADATEASMKVIQGELSQHRGYSETAVSNLRQTLDTQNSKILELARSVEVVAGNLMGVDKRGYEADTNMRRDIDDLRKRLEAGHSRPQNGVSTPSN
jgi:uncharacterized protein HemX